MRARVADAQGPNDPLCSKLSYALTFANESPNRYWVPLKGNPTHAGFIDFYHSDLSIFAGDARWTKLMEMYGFGPRGSDTTDDAPISDDPNAPTDDIGADASDVDDDAEHAPDTLNTFDISKMPEDMREQFMAQMAQFRAYMV